MDAVTEILEGGGDGGREIQGYTRRTAHDEPDQDADDGQDAAPWS